MVPHYLLRVVDCTKKRRQGGGSCGRKLRTLGGGLLKITFAFLIWEEIGRGQKNYSAFGRTCRREVRGGKGFPRYLKEKKKIIWVAQVLSRRKIIRRGLMS